MSAYPFPTDPKVFGPGLWYSIHIMAVKATTYESMMCFVKYMIEVSKTLPCVECRTHCQRYIETHPMERYWDKVDSKGRKVGMFYWSWEFHNAANKRLGKPLISNFDDAYAMYTNPDMACKSDCAAGAIPDTESSVSVSSGGIRPTRH